MSLSEYEKRLQAANPRLRIKRVRGGMANVMLGNKSIARVDTGELTLYNQFEYRIGQSDQFMTDFNPKGNYKYKYMIKRGRAELARVLHTSRVIGISDVTKLS